jgi:hypothetical protein
LALHVVLLEHSGMSMHVADKPLPESWNPDPHEHVYPPEEFEHVP